MAAKPAKESCGCNYKKRGHYHHLSASMRAVIGKYASKNGISAAGKHTNYNFIQLVGVLEIIANRQNFVPIQKFKVDRKFSWNVSVVVLKPCRGNEEDTSRG